VDDREQHADADDEASPRRHRSALRAVRRSVVRARRVRLVGMKFVIEHTFAVTPAEYEALYFDEQFNVALGDHLGLGRELRRFDRSAARIVRHVCCEPKRDPDSPAGKAFGTTRASYVEEMDYDVHARRGAWRTIPNILPERVKTEGTLEIANV